MTFSLSARQTICRCAAVVMFCGLALTLPLAAQAPRLLVSPEQPEPGAIVRVALDGAAVLHDSVVEVHGTLSGEPLHFLRAGPGTWHAIGGVSVDAADSVVARVVVTYTGGSADTLRTAIDVPPVPPPAPASRSKLSVSTRFTKPMSTATQRRIARENAKARAIGRSAHLIPPLWTQPFLRPRDAVITSPFGSGRVFNGSLTSRHLGVDFRGAVGDPIRAANRGVVALVDTFFLAGRVVYIDHGGGVVTGYFHMSTPLVTKGDTVQRGQVIGLVGATGRVTGPHLHWNARYGAVTVNPMDLVTLDARWYPPSRAALGASSRQ